MTIKNKHNYGWTRDHPDHRDFRYVGKTIFGGVLPDKIDLRRGCSSVEQQGRLGSCTANALVGALEFLHIKKAISPPIDLSRLFLYYNERAIEGTVKWDSGAQIRDGVKSLVKQGCCKEGLWPYVVSKFTLKPPHICYQDAAGRQLMSYHRIDQNTALMRSCLAEGYPFVFGFSVYDSFESDAVATSGNVPMPTKDERFLGGHAVMCVGYDDAKRRFIVRNSWGKSWGDQGYCYMPYGYLDNEGLAADFWTLRLAEG